MEERPGGFQDCAKKDLTANDILYMAEELNDFKGGMETYKPDYAIKLSARNFGFEDRKKIVPLYTAFCI